MQAESRRSIVSRSYMGQVWYLFAFCLVMILLASPPLCTTSASGDATTAVASGGGSSTTEVRRSPKQTIHVSAMSYESSKREKMCVIRGGHEFGGFEFWK